jgi:hypothetical protein
MIKFKTLTQGNANYKFIRHTLYKYDWSYGAETWTEKYEKESKIQVMYMEG